MKCLFVLTLVNLFLYAKNVEIEINKEFYFDTNTNQNEFSLNYLKETEKASIFILFYEIKTGVTMVIQRPGIDSTIRGGLYESNRYFSFSFTGNGNYILNFGTKFTEGKLKLVSSDKPFNLDINEDIIFNNILKIDTEDEPCPLIIYLDNNSNENLMKRIGNDYIKIYKMFISENEANYEEVIGEFIYFNKNSKYSIKIEFLEMEYDFKYFFVIAGFSLTNLESKSIKIEEFSIGKKYYEKDKILFTKINLKDYNRFYVITDNDLNYSYIDNEELFNDFPKDIQYLKFNNSLINQELIKIEKPQEKDYMILFVEFKDQENNFIHFVKQVEVELNKENQFDGENMLFKLNYEKKNSENALLCLFYEFKNENEESIDIKVFKDMSCIESRTTIKINSDSFNFIIEDSGEYLFLLSSIGTVVGNFTIVSSEYEFSIDANKEIYFYNDFKEEVNFQSILTFSISNIDKNYKKLYSSVNDLEDIISYKKNKKENEEFVPMKKVIFLYEKGDSIIIRLDIKKITSNDYIHISNLDENNILNLEYKEYELPGQINKIFKINYLSSPYFEIEGDDSNRYYISYVDKTSYDSIDKYLDYLTFNKSNDNIYIKPVDAHYGILIVEIINKMISTTLTIKKLDPPVKELNFDSEQNFNSFFSKYRLKYEKKEKEDNEMFIFMYKMSEYSKNFEMNVTGPNNYAKTNIFDNKEKFGSYAFENGENGSYEISFFSEESFEGTFRIVKSSEPTKININDDIKINTFNTTFEPKPIILEFDTKGLSHDLYKELLIGENNINLNLIQISSNDFEYKNLYLNYYAFEKEREYKIKIEYIDLGNNQYQFGQFLMNDFKFDLEDFQFCTKIYQNISIIKFVKIDLTNFSKILIKAENDPIFKIAYYNDDIEIAKILDDLVFEDLKDYIITDKSYNKAVLMIKLKLEETKIEFSDGNENNDDKKDDDNNNKNNKNLIIVVVLAGGFFILLIIIIFLIHRKRKAKFAEIDLGKENKKEELMMQSR